MTKEYFTIFSNKFQHNGVKPAESLTCVGPKSKVLAKLDQVQFRLAPIWPNNDLHMLAKLGQV